MTMVPQVECTLTIFSKPTLFQLATGVPTFEWSSTINQSKTSLNQPIQKHYPQQDKLISLSAKRAHLSDLTEYLAMPRI